MSDDTLLRIKNRIGLLPTSLDLYAATAIGIYAFGRHVPALLYVLIGLEVLVAVARVSRGDKL